MLLEDFAEFLLGIIKSRGTIFIKLLLDLEIGIYIVFLGL
jgi:hypothetical protein